MNSAARPLLLLAPLFICLTSPSEGVCHDTHAVFPSFMRDKASYEISDLIYLLLPEQGEYSIDWSHLNHVDDFHWITPGYLIEEGRRSHIYYKTGMIRVNNMGNVSRILYDTSREVVWTIRYQNTTHPALGVTEIFLNAGTPGNTCFGSQFENCTFSIEESLARSPLIFHEICSHHEGTWTLISYQVDHPFKHPAIVTISTSIGSGGSFSDISINLGFENAPDSECV